MATQWDILSAQLELTCRLSGAQWAAWLQFSEKGWRVNSGVHLKKSRRVVLDELIQTKEIAAWLAGSLHTGRVRSRNTAELVKILGSQRMFCFANPNRENILLVGANGLSGENQSLFRVLSMSEFSNNGIIKNKVLTQPIQSSSDNNIALNTKQLLLIELAESSLSNDDPEKVIQLVNQELRKIYKTERAAVFLLSADGKRLREYGDQLGPYPMVIPVDTSLAGYVIEHGNAIRFDNFNQIPRIFGETSGLNSVMAAPIRSHNEILGVLMVQSDQVGYFTLSDEKLLIVLAGQLFSIIMNKEVNLESRVYARNLDLIHQVVQQIVGLTDIQAIAQRTAELMAEYFGYEFVIILTPDATKTAMVILGIGGTRASMIPLGYSYLRNEGIIGYVFNKGVSYLSNDVSNDPHYLPIPDWHAGSELCIPLREADQVIGVINLERLEKGGFSASDQILVESLAGILSTVMMNATRYQQLSDKLNQDEVVRETGLDLVENLEPEILLKRIVHRARGLVHARGAEIGLVEEDQRGIRVQTSENPWYDFTGHLIPIGKGIAGQVLLTGQPVSVSDYNSWPDRLVLERPADFITAAGVPLMFKNQVIGTLVVMDDRPERLFSDEDIKTLELISRSIALAIHNSQLFTEIKEAIEAQRQAESRLIQSERMAAAGRLTASIAHEINNPLQALYNCLHLAERSELSPGERHKYLTMARSELDRLISTVTRMLDFYRPGARDRQQTNINDLINRTVALVEPQLIQKHIQISTQLTPNLPSVMVVQSQIQQVLFNLVINAMEAMPDGGNISIETAVCDSLSSGRRKSRRQTGAAGIEIIMRDTGPGIPHEERERIFEPFISTKDEGMGLGLSVSFGIIQAHGGTLNLIFEDKYGACFRIVLPEEN